jgi:hypothetical protein
MARRAHGGGRGDEAVMPPAVRLDFIKAMDLRQGGAVVGASNARDCSRRSSGESAERRKGAIERNLSSTDVVAALISAFRIVRSLSALFASMQGAWGGSVVREGLKEAATIF